MQKLSQWNRFVGAHFPWFVLACAVTGVLFPDAFSWLNGPITMGLFAFMTFANSLSGGFRELGRVFLRPLPVVVTLVLLHVVIPVLTLGIPGDGATAIMMGALMVQGLQPGPLLFVEKAPAVYAIFIGLLLANVIMGIMGFSLIKLFMKVVNVPVHILLPIIVMMTFVGTYSYNNSLNDVYLMVASGFLGYFMNKLGFSMSAIIIGIILGGMAEQNFVGSLIMSDGSFAIFFQRPLCLFFLVAALLSLLSPLFGKLFKRS